MKAPLLVSGMHGLGDNIHQRAILRQLMRDRDVWLETSWVSVYHDLIKDGLKLVHKGTSLRAQTANAKRETAGFSNSPGKIPSMKVWYTPADVRSCRSVLGAMCKSVGADPEKADFRLPISGEWIDLVGGIIKKAAGKPILVYRPLVERKEWGGCRARNPDFDTYFKLFLAIRENFFVISLADLFPGLEWAVGREIKPDLACHAGELKFESLAALVSRAAMTFCSPGFAVPLSQAVGTPVCCVFGGYESAYSFSAGARFSPYLGIEPINPCDCFRHDHACDKRIDIQAALDRVRGFAADASRRPGRSVSD